MGRFSSGYKRAARFQSELWVKLTLSILVAGISAAIFVPILVESYSFRGRMIPLMQEMYSSTAEDESPAIFLETGEYVFQGVTYGGPEFIEFAKTQFTPGGEFVDPGSLATFLLTRSIPEWMPSWLLVNPGTTWLLLFCIFLWLLLVIWLELVIQLLTVVVVTAAAILLAALCGLPSMVVGLAGIGLLTFTFALLMRLAILFWGGQGPLAAIASGVLREASRTRLSLLFIIILLVLLPLLPMALDSESPLRYQVQTFISHSMQLTFAIAACLTLILGCATISFEIRDRQIWQVMSKPVARGRYLLGKWLGIITVNLILVMVAMLSIFILIQYLRSQPVADGLQGELDRLAITDEILTARLPSYPDYPKLSSQEVQDRVDVMFATDPALGDQDAMAPRDMRRIRYEISQNFGRGLRSVAPGLARAYMFSGLGDARRLSPTATVQFRFLIDAVDEHKTYQVAFRFNNDDRTLRPVTYVPAQTHVLHIPSDYISPEGELLVELMNINRPNPGSRGTGAINFSPNDLRLLYKVGNFEPNFLKAVLQTWIKLCFLAALAVACATFLNFPVACLMSFTIFLGAVMTPYLAGSLWTYAPSVFVPFDTSSIGGMVHWLFDRTIQGIANTIVFALSWFGEYQPREDLVEGRYITWMSIGSSILRIGIVWCGISLLLGFLVLRQRQLAVYSGSS